MTNSEIYQTVREYWNELYTDKLPSLDRCIWRIKESDKIYNALMCYHSLCMQHQKEVKM
jgi:hypothetical protein